MESEGDHVEGTLTEDGDAVDILVIIEEPTFPGCLMNAKPIGLLRMKDEKGSDNGDYPGLGEVSHWSLYSIRCLKEDMLRV